MRAFYKHKDWNATCDVCGLRFKASELKHRWDNKMVCKEDFEQRHPIDFLRVKEEKIQVDWKRLETDQFTSITYNDQQSTTSFSSVAYKAIAGNAISGAA